MTETLVSIERELTALVEEMEGFTERGEEVPDGLKARVREMVRREEVKVTAIGNVILRLRREAEACAADAQDYLDRGRRREGEAKRLARFIASVMRDLNLTQLESATVTLTRLDGRQSVECVDRDAVPDEYRKQPEWEPDKKKVKDAIDGGAPCPAGFKVSVGEPSLRVYR